MVAVLDANVSLGSEGALGLDLKAKLCGRSDGPLVVDFIAGLGGREINPLVAEDIVGQALEAAQAPAPPWAPIWVGLDASIVA